MSVFGTGHDLIYTMWSVAWCISMIHAKKHIKERIILFLFLQINMDYVLFLYLVMPMWTDSLKISMIVAG